MSLLSKRVDKLEQVAGGEERPVFVWRDLGETAEQAIGRHFGAAGAPASVAPVVVGWIEP